MPLELIRNEILKEKELSDELGELTEINANLIRDNHDEVLIKIYNYFLQINELLQLADKKNFVSTYVYYETEDLVYKESICTSICNNKVFIKLIKDDGYLKTEDSFIEFDLALEEKISYISFNKYPYELIIRKIISIWKDYQQNIEDNLFTAIKENVKNKQMLIDKNKEHIESLKYMLES